MLARLVYHRLDENGLLVAEIKLADGVEIRLETLPRVGESIELGGELLETLHAAEPSARPHRLFTVTNIVHRVGTIYPGPTIYLRL